MPSGGRAQAGRELHRQRPDHPGRLAAQLDDAPPLDERGELVERVEARGKSADDLLEHGAERARAPPPKIAAVAPPPEFIRSFDVASAPPTPEPKVEVKPAPAAALPPALSSSTLEVQAPAPRPALKRFASASVDFAASGRYTRIFETSSGAPTWGDAGAIDQDAPDPALAHQPQNFVSVALEHAGGTAQVI